MLVLSILTTKNRRSRATAKKDTGRLHAADAAGASAGVSTVQEFARGCNKTSEENMLVVAVKGWRVCTEREVRRRMYGPA